MSLRALQSLADGVADRVARRAWRLDPIKFCREHLGVEPCGKQADILRAFAFGRYVLVDSCNGFGKTSCSGWCANYVYECYDPSVTVVTAPTQRQVSKALFKEIRRYYKGRHAQPKADEIGESAEHMIFGFTAINEDKFQGIRDRTLAVIVDEHNGIAEEIFTAIRGMLSACENAFWLNIGNPTDPGSPARQMRDAAEAQRAERGESEMTLIRLSAFEHPNIPEELCGRAPVVPSAVALRGLKSNMEAWGQSVADPEKVLPGDVDLLRPETYGLPALPPGLAEGVLRHFPARWWRPATPEAFSRILGLYPPQSEYAVFDADDFDRAARTTLPFDAADGLAIGCDVARFGDDRTSFHVRRGPVSLFHDAFQGQDTTRTAATLKQLCDRFAAQHRADPRQVPVLIDESGVGGGVVDKRGTYNFRGVNAAWAAKDDLLYPNTRSELAFRFAALLEDGAVDFSRLAPAAVAEIRRQALWMTYKLDGRGRRVLEPKDKTKARIRRSPDDLDAVLLCYSGAGSAWEAPERATLHRRDPHEPRPGRRDGHGVLRERRGGGAD